MSVYVSAPVRKPGRELKTVTLLGDATEELVAYAQMRGLDTATALQHGFIELGGKEMEIAVLDPALKHIDRNQFRAKKRTQERRKMAS